MCIRDRFLHPSPPSIAAPAAGGLCLQPTTIRFGLRRTHRGRHGLRRSPCCPDGRRPCLDWLSGAPTVKPSWDRISTRTRRRAATAASPAPPAVDYGFGPGGAPRPSARRANTPPRVPRPRPGPPTAATPAPAASSVPTVPIPSDRECAEPVGPPFLRLTPPLGDTPLCLLYTSPSPRDLSTSRMPSSA